MLKKDGVSMSLKEVFELVRSQKGDRDDWLIVATIEGTLLLDTQAGLGRVEIDEDTLAEKFPAPFNDGNFHSTIDYDTLEDCIGWADKLKGHPDNNVALRVLVHYLRQDAWPSSLSDLDDQV